MIEKGDLKKNQQPIKMCKLHKQANTLYSLNRGPRQKLSLPGFCRTLSSIFVCVSPRGEALKEHSLPNESEVIVVIFCFIYLRLKKKSAIFVDSPESRH